MRGKHGGLPEEATFVVLRMGPWKKYGNQWGREAWDRCGREGTCAGWDCTSSLNQYEDDMRCQSESPAESAWDST